MTVQTIRPDATIALGSFSAVPSGTLAGVTSDNSDATYALSSTTLNSYMSLGLGTYTLLSDQRVKLVRARQRSAASANSTSSNLIINDSTIGGLGGLWAQQLAITQPNTTIATTTGSWITPPRELTQAVIDGLRLQVAQTFSTSGSQLRVHELYLDLDVRTRPIIDTFSASPSGDTVTFAGTFTYDTSGNTEVVTVSVEVFDDQDVLITTVSQQLSGVDFSATVFSIPYSSAFGSFTARATVTASGFTVAEPTFSSLESEASFTVSAAGVEAPILTCETDQAAQEVVLTIEQADNILPPSVDCLRIESFGTGALGNQATFTGAAGEQITTADKAQLDLTGSMTVTMWVSATDWTPAANRTLFSKMPGTLLSGYSATLLTTGLLQFTIGTGAATRTMTSTAPGLTDGQGYWLEFFYDDTAKTCRFRKSSDALLAASPTWTTISTSAAHAGGSPAANSESLQVGSLAGGSTWVGKIGRFSLLNASSTQVASLTLPIEDVGTTSIVDGVNTWTVSGGAAIGLGTAVITTVGSPRHAQLWTGPTGFPPANVLTTPDLVFGANSVTIVGDTSSLSGLFNSKLVVATVGGGVSNVTLIAYDLTGPGPISIGVATTNVIVQARQSSTGLQAELDISVLSGTVFIGGSFSEAVTVLVLTEVVTGAVCVPTVSGAIAAATQDQVVPHQFASQLTLTTFVRTSDTRVSWPGVTLGVGEVVVDNDGGAGTIYISGYLAVFDDPDAVRAEVRRNDELIPLDGLNGALVPPYGEGVLVVVDRFPPRFRAPTCADDPEPVGPTYQVRFYGYVDGVLAYSPWATCTPDAVITNGAALLRHPLDASLDVDGCVTTENFQRVRPFSSAQPADGGLEFVRTGTVSGRDFSVVLEAPDTESALLIDALLSSAYIWYSPLDVGIPALWLAPTTATPFSGYKHDTRPYSISQTFIEVEAEPVELPPAGPPSS
jgi:hypothetical protein